MKKWFVKKYASVLKGISSFSISVLKLTTAMSLLVFLTGAYLFQHNVKFIRTVGDIATAVGDDIPLKCNTYYIRTNFAVEYTDKSLLFPAGCDSGIIGINILSSPLVYTGTGTFLKSTGGVNSIRLQNITLASPSGTLFDITGLSRLSTFIRMIDVITSNVDSLGSFDTISVLADNIQFDDFGQGLVAENARLTANSFSFSSPKNVTKDTSCTFDNTTNTVLAIKHWMYDNDIVRLKTDGTLPTGLSTGFSDLNGAVFDNGDGTVRFTTTAVNNLSTGDTIIPRGTVNYDNTYIIIATPTTTTFDIVAPFVAETFVNNVAQLGYYVVNKTTDDFQLSRTEGGAVEPFTTDGTGVQEFFENSIGLTMRGSVYSFTLEKPVFAGTGKDFTPWDFEPTISGAVSRASIIGQAFDTQEYFNQYTGSSFNPTYPYFTIADTKLGFDSRGGGTIYFLNNANATPLDQNTPAPIAEATYTAHNMERRELDTYKMCNTSPNPSSDKVFLILTIRGTTAIVKSVKIYIYLNNESISVGTPNINVANIPVIFADTEDVVWGENDCISVWVENTTNDENLITSDVKLIN